MAHATTSRNLPTLILQRISEHIPRHRFNGRMKADQASVVVGHRIGTQPLLLRAPHAIFGKLSALLIGKHW